MTHDGGSVTVPATASVPYKLTRSTSRSDRVAP